MSSILTNTSAMTALATLRSVNHDLSDTQNQISTGKKVGTAKDNAAVWAVSAVMQSDVTGFKAITDTLALGSSTLNVARNGAETVNKLLDELKGRIISSQEENVDRAKINNDASELRSNIEATVGASQFNGLNLLKGDHQSGSVDVLGSLDRDASGNVTVSNISVDRQSLETSKVDIESVSGAAGATVVATTVLDMTGGGTVDYTDYAVGDVVALQLTNSDGQGVVLQTEITQAQLDAAAAADATTPGDGIVNLATAVFGELSTKFGALAADEFDTTGFTLTDAADGTLTLATDGTQTADFKASGAAGGGLTALSLVDLSDKGGAKAALSVIEELTQTSIDAAAGFGSSGKRVDIQMDFMKDLTDSFTSGIGSLVDADMEATSARLKALQTQQQLATQSLTIANQAPQSLMSLFR